MEISRHICFRTKEHPALVNYLEANGIPYDKGDSLSAVDIHKSSQYWPYIKEYMQVNKLICQSNTIYTKEELNRAEWLQVWCRWRCGYPQPENTFSSNQKTYSRAEYCHTCGRGEVQIAPFRMKKTPKWGKRCFAELNWIYDELFLNEYAKDVLVSCGVTGISFREVCNSKGTAALDDVFQLVVSHVLEPGFVVEKTNIKSIDVCSECGQTKYVPSGISMYAYKKEIFENAPDVVRTSDLFGSMHCAVSRIMIKQDVYQLILKHHMERGLVFEPILLV